MDHTDIRNCESTVCHSSGASPAVMVREDIFIPKLSIFFLSVVLSVVAVTYYQMYFHYWFVELKGGRIMRLGFLMLPLSFMTLQYFLMRRKRFTIRNDSLTKINIILVVYLLFSMLSILANEMDYNDARIYSAQIAYPVLLYFCILGVCKTIDYIKAAMRVIFFVAVICGLYAMYYYVTYDTGRIMEYYLSNDITGPSARSASATASTGGAALVAKIATMPTAIRASNTTAVLKARTTAVHSGRSDDRTPENSSASRGTRMSSTRR